MLQIPNLFLATMSYIKSLEQQKDPLINFVQGSLWQRKKKFLATKKVFYYLLHFITMMWNLETVLDRTRVKIK